MDCVFSVTSLDQNGDDSFWSDYNQYKDISAPGDNIYSTVGIDDYVAFSGTSMASPLVSGIAALMFAAVPGVHPDDVVDVIQSTAHSMEGKTNYRGNATGSAGAIDAAAALEKLMAEYGDTDYFLYNCTVDITGIDEEGDQYYTGSDIIPEITITAPDGTVLTEASSTESPQGDYVVTFKDNVNAGTAYITITGINRCSGTRSESFRIYYNLDEHGFIGAIPAQSYDQNEIMPLPQVSYDSMVMTPVKDYVIRYEDNNAVGTAKIYIDGINDYLGSLSGTFQIIDGYGQVQTPKAISGLRYNGRVQTGVPSSVNGHYTITGNTATDSGEYVAVAKIADGFVWEDGTKDDKLIPYSIERADAVLSVEKTGIFLKNDTDSVSLRIVYMGDTAQSLTVTSEDEGVATARIDDNILTIQGVAPGITRLTLSAPQGQNYNAVESTVVVEVQGKTEYAVESTPSGVSLEYNGQLQSGILATDGYEFTPITEGCSLDEIGNAVARDAGVYKVGVKKIANYPWQNEASPETEIITFEILPVDGERVKILDIAPVTYTGLPIQPSVEALFKDVKLAEESDYTLTYSDNVDAGIATAQLVFNGNYTGAAAEKFEITKASAVLSVEPQSFTFDLNQGNQVNTAVITYTGDGMLTAVSNDVSVAAVSVEGQTLEISAGGATGDAVITISASGETNYLAVEPVTVTVKVTATSTIEPTAAPTAEPTTPPTMTPTDEPTATPTAEPTATPTAEPTAAPTDEPTATPTAEPTTIPTVTPTDEPTTTPTIEPIPTDAPDDLDYIIEDASVVDGKLQASLVYHGSDMNPTAKLIVASYDGNIMTGVWIFDVNGEDIDFGTDSYTLPDGDKIRLFIWNDLGKMIPLAQPKDVN